MNFKCWGNEELSFLTKKWQYTRCVHKRISVNIINCMNISTKPDSRIWPLHCRTEVIFCLVCYRFLLHFDIILIWKFISVKILKLFSSFNTIFILRHTSVLGWFLFYHFSDDLLPLLSPCLLDVISSQAYCFKSAIYWTVLQASCAFYFLTYECFFDSCLSRGSCCRTDDCFYPWTCFETFSRYIICCQLSNCW